MQWSSAESVTSVLPFSPVIAAMSSSTTSFDSSGYCSRGSSGIVSDDVFENFDWDLVSNIVYPCGQFLK